MVLDVQLDVGDLCSDWRSVRNREAVPCAKLFFTGPTRAMVGVSRSSLSVCHHRASETLPLLVPG
jgi:hypothetical protein